MPENPDSQTLTPSSTDLQTAITQVAADAALGDATIPLEIKVGAQVFRGANPQELLSELTKAQEHATALIADQKRQLAETRAELDRLNQIPAAAQDTNAYNPTKAYELFTKDPREYQTYMNQFDEQRQEFNRAVEAITRQSEIDKFKGTVGFNPSQEEAVAFGQEFASSRLEPNATNFELVYYRMVNQGKLNPSPITSIQSRGAPPPHLGGGGSPPNAGFDMAAFERLPANQQLEVINRLKAQGYPQ